MPWIKVAESGWVPDFIIRRGIHSLLKFRLAEQANTMGKDLRAAKQAFVEELRGQPIAIETDKANEQHYELPPEFFVMSLGDHLKYSSCFYETFTESLSVAEKKMLELTCERAELAPGQKVLELGCGWGSLTLFMAARFPGSHFTAVSNSKPQREYILSQAKARGISNVEVITSDINHLELPENQFDRVVSVEMFEHLRNYEMLFQKIARWLKSDGKMFVHIFCHRQLAYPFETEGNHNWMGRYFFTGGLMPSMDLFEYFQKDLSIEKTWSVDGRHYERTSNQWLEKLDQNRDKILEVFTKTYGAEARVWLQRWRIFYMSVAELFGYNHGQEWLVAHYLFKKGAVPKVA
ncbi:MAG: SAM-dependent methyltransferase [Pseudobdellovibrionaceae bacterium]